MTKYFLVLLFTAFSVSGFAQKSWKTQLVPGFSSTKYSNRYRSVSLPPNSFFVELNEDWNRQPENQFSLVKEFGLALKYNNLKQYYDAALGGRSYYTGAYIYSTFHLAVLGQFKIRQNLSIQFGPRIEVLVIGHEKTTREWYFYSSPPQHGVDETSEFNRNYFDQPYYGLNLKLLKARGKKSKNAGISFSYFWTKSKESNFETKRMLSAAFVIQL